MIRSAQTSIILLNTLERPLFAGLHNGSEPMRWLFAALNGAACAAPRPARMRSSSSRPERPSKPDRRAIVPKRPSLRSGIERYSPVLAVDEILEDEPVSLFDTHFRSPSCREFERGDSPSSARDAPGREAVLDADDRAVA